MNIRKLKEKNEELTLSKFATKSINSKGREKGIEQCDIRTCFERDRDRIIHSKAFRRLKDKTQVFISPEGDHFRTRLTHTIEVSQVARSISDALFLNSNLTEAIALGHDLGHTPFGHLGEEVLSNLLPYEFHHNQQSIRVVKKIEKNGQGLNLCEEVLDGILNHRGNGAPSTLEGKVVQISDKIAYIAHDIDDAIRANVFKREDLPKECIDVLGNNSKQIINFLIRDIIKNSSNKNEIIMTEKYKKLMYKLRKFLFKNFYKSELLQIERDKFASKLENLFNFYNENFDKIPTEFKNLYNLGESKERTICDYISGMTDRYAITKINELV